MRTIRFLGTLVAGALLALVTGEAIMRLLSFAPLAINPKFGWVVEEGATTRWRFEGNGVGHFGRNGVRAKPSLSAEEHPILVVGDSLTESLHVDDDQTFSAAAERELAARNLPIPVANVGRAGRRAPTYVQLADAFQSELAPRWTVVAIKEDDLAEEARVKTGTYFSGGYDGEPLQLHPVSMVGAGGRMRGFFRDVRARSALLQRLKIKFKELSNDAKNQRFFREGDPVPKKDKRRDPGKFPVREELDMLVNAFDRRITILFLSPYDAEAPGSSTPFEDAVFAYCRDEKVSCVSARNAWPAFARRGDVPYGFPNSGWNVGHMNAEAHRAVGKLLADELEALAKNGIFESLVFSVPQRPAHAPRASAHDEE